MKLEGRTAGSTEFDLSGVDQTSSGIAHSREKLQVETVQYYCDH